MLKAVIFDLDGVLTDTAQFHFVAWRELAQSLGLPFDEVFNERLKGIDRQGSLERILAQGHRRYTEHEKLALAHAKNARYLELVATMTPAHLLPGALDALNAVRAAGLKTGLASASRNAPLVLSRLGIASCLDTVVDAATVPQGKPHPGIFLAAAAQLGVTPVDCLGVEDAVAGVQAIKAAGMRALGIGDARVLHEADAVIASLAGFDLDHWGELRPTARLQG